LGRLFWKIFLGLSLTLLATGAGVGLAVHLYGQARVAQLADLAAGPRADFAVAAVAAVLAHGGPAAVEPLFAEWPRQRPTVLVVDAQGRDLLGRAVPAAALGRARTELQGEARALAVRQVTEPDGRSYILFIPAAERTAAAGAYRGHRPPPTYFFALRLGATLLASLLFSAALAWYLTRPLRRLREASRRLAEGALDTRVTPAMGRRSDEIADLGRDFDHMASRLQALVGAQRRLLHDVSHELRSPLARLQVAVGLARQQPDKAPGALDRIERESQRLDELVGELLTLSRLEAGVDGPGEDYVDLAELLAAVVEDVCFEAQARGRRVELAGAGEIVVNGRAELLRWALENLIRNAVSYAPPGTAVEVTARREAGGEGVTVAVCDRGPGLAEADLESVFEPFFQAGEQAGRGGYGLGLAIARRAVQAHAGRIRAANRPGGGLCVEITLPTVANVPEGA
jgi:two-component system OmpR family sensor kinase